MARSPAPPASSVRARITTQQHKPRSGAAAVELAVLLPVLALLFSISVYFARVYQYQVVLETCARNGAHLASNLRSYQETGWVSPYDAVKDAAVADGASLNPPLQQSQVNVAYGTGSDGNSNVTVSISYTFSLLTPFMASGNTISLSAQNSMRVAP